FGVLAAFLLVFAFFDNRKIKADYLWALGRKFRGVFLGDSEIGIMSPFDQQLGKLGIGFW
ncbi:hypothetical protein NY536_22445, partial [Enterobacter hormaechei]|nr:hypothetical protein [Enterobacter hormaechei]